MEEHCRLSAALNELKRTTGLDLDVKSGAYTDEEFVVNQLESLCTAYREKYDRNHFFHRLFFTEFPEYEINEWAAKLHITPYEKRNFFLLETQTPYEDTLTIVLRHMFPAQSGAYLIPVSETRLVLLQAVQAKNITKEFRLQTARSIRDTLSAEALVSVKIACGPMITHLRELGRAFADAENAITVGKLFYCQQSIFLHDHVGIGGLIYGLPIETCRHFLNKVFKNKVPESLDPEWISTTNCFLQNNFNIAETARQLHMHRNTLIYRLEQIEKRTGLDLRSFEDAMTFKIVLMVMNYVSSKSKEEL